MSRLISLAIALCLILSLASVPASATAAEPVTVTAMIWAQVGAELSSDQLVFKTIAEKTGVTFDFTNVPGADFQQKFQVTMASGNVPDVIEGTTGVDEYIFAGAFAQLDELYKTEGPNILARFDSMGVASDLKFTDGHYYTVPRLSERVFQLNNHINNRWLKELGLKMPTTLEELYDVLVAFRDHYENSVPLGCGLWAGSYNSVVNLALYSYGIQRDFYYYGGDAMVYAPYQMADRYKAALTWLNKAYTEKLIDQQMYATTDDEIMKYYQADKVGFFRGWADGFALWGEGGTYGEDVVPAPVLGTAEFGPGLEVRTDPKNGNYYISANSKYQAQIVRAFNYIYSDEGVELMNWGVKGVTFDVDANGNKFFTDVIMKNDNGPVVGRYQQGMVPPHFVCVADKASEYLLNNPLTAEFEKLIEGKTFPLQPSLSATLDETNEFSFIMTDINKYVTEQEMQFITGQLSIADNFDNFIATLKSMNIERAIEIKNAQYQRYLSK